MGVVQPQPHDRACDVDHVLVGRRVIYPLHDSEFYDLFQPIIPVELECGRDDQDDDWSRARPFQEDGHLADDAYHKEHDA